MIQFSRIQDCHQHTGDTGSPHAGGLTTCTVEHACSEQPASQCLQARMHDCAPSGHDNCRRLLMAQEVNALQPYSACVKGNVARH